MATTTTTPASLTSSGLSRPLIVHVQFASGPTRLAAPGVNNKVVSGVMARGHSAPAAATRAGGLTCLAFAEGTKSLMTAGLVAGAYARGSHVVNTAAGGSTGGEGNKPSKITWKEYSEIAGSYLDELSEFDNTVKEAKKLIQDIEKAHYFNDTQTQMLDITRKCLDRLIKETSGGYINATTVTLAAEGLKFIHASVLGADPALTEATFEPAQVTHPLVENVEYYKRLCKHLTFLVDKVHDAYHKFMLDRNC